MPDDRRSELPVMVRAERALAHNLRVHVETRRSARAHLDVDVLEVEGSVAAFMGVGSPLTTVKGLRGDATSHGLAEIEAFFRAHRAPAVTIELAPWLDATTREVLVRRGYQLAGHEDVVSRVVDADAAVLPRPTLEVTAIAVEPWVAISQQGFDRPIDDAVRELVDVAVRLPGSVRLGVRAGDRWIACGQVVVEDDTVIFANDSTIPEARRMGAQTALIQARLATVNDGSLVIAEVAPGSRSERNYLRCGFEVAYTRTQFTYSI